MVTRGIVQKVISETEVQVKVPMFGMIEEEEDEAQVNELPIARICTTPGCHPNFKKDDIVLISIEDNDLNTVMIMGRLIPDDKSVGTSVATFENLLVEKDTVLSKNTQIGDVLAENIAHLEGSEYNLQEQLNTNMNQKIEFLEFMSKALDAVSFI